jgi:hypothetical protein
MAKICLYLHSTAVLLVLLLVMVLVVPLATGGYWTAERSALLELQFGGKKGPNGQIRKSPPL